MFSVPNIGVNPSMINPMQMSLFNFQPQHVVSASALTPSTTFAVPTIPMMTTVGSISNLYAPNFPLYPSIVSYPDVNSDRKLRLDVTEYFYDKVIKNWLRYHYLDLYQMLTVSGNTSSLVKDQSQIASNTKNDPTENTVKYEYIIRNYLTQNDVGKLLNKFRKINNINWWDIKQHQDKVRKYINYKVAKAMKYDIVEGSKK
jgi:hypothetical protein